MRELIYAYIQVILEGVDFHAQICQLKTAEISNNYVLDGKYYLFGAIIKH